MLPNDEQERDMLLDKMQLLRSVTNSDAMSETSIIMDATRYIQELKDKVGRANQESEFAAASLISTNNTNSSSPSCPHLDGPARPPTPTAGHHCRRPATAASLRPPPLATGHLSTVLFAAAGIRPMPPEFGQSSRSHFVLVSRQEIRWSFTTDTHRLTVLPPPYYPATNGSDCPDCPRN
ncbi:unnamed protein product [Cuscuta epithymum]|uniref:BHLH domain-containing protein n=1 Tax=Cuscuta epithymum TaxID=186058 RepID=A0AAV0EBY9_9ASTE|nr:unnamed protein product [Cuscuta epithymum]